MNGKAKNKVELAFWLVAVVMTTTSFVIHVDRAVWWNWDATWTLVALLGTVRSIDAVQKHWRDL